MRIWLVTVGEPLPIDGPAERLYRTGILANMLAGAGHDVVWWTSAFDHARKRQRFSSNGLVTITEKLKIILLHSIPYYRNISVRRIINHILLKRQFEKLATDEAKPDIILCSLPTIGLAAASVEYGQKNGVPVVLDIRDLWPDILVDVVPKALETPARLVLGHAFRAIRYACANATAIVGTSNSFVDWGVNYAGRPRTDRDQAFPLAYASDKPDAEAIAQARRFWQDFGLMNDPGQSIICFFGNMSGVLDLTTVIQAAAILEGEGTLVKLVLCGSGDREGYYRDLAKKCKAVLLPGRVDKTQIWALMDIAVAGLVPYQPREDFCKALPNKAVEYLAGGLPIISCLHGELAALIAENRCGITYEDGNARQLATMIKKVHNAKDFTETMAKNSCRLYEQAFSAEMVYGQLVAHLQEIVHCHKAGDHLGAKGVTYR